MQGGEWRELEAASLVCNSRSNKNLYCLEWRSRSRSRRSWVYCATIRKEGGEGRGSCCCRYIPPPSYCICSGRSEFSSSSSSSHPVPVVLYCTASSLLQLWLQEKHYIVQLGGILGRYAVFIHGKNVVVKRFLSFDENAMSIFVSQERSNSLSPSR